MLADSEDDVPLASRLVPQRAAAKRAASAPPAPPPPPKRAAKATKLAKPAKKLTPIAADEEGDEEDEDEDGDDGEGAPSGSKPSARPKAKDNGEDVWQTLEHHGVLFPPAYVPHGVPLLCDGAVVQLTPVEEEASPRVMATCGRLVT